MLGEDRVGFVQREHHRQRIDRLRDADGIGVDPKRRGRVAQPLHREHHVVGRERRAVMELDARTQLHAPQQRGHLGPLGGQRRPDVLVGRAPCQGLVDLAVQRVVQDLVRGMGVGALHVALSGPAQGLGVGERGGGEQGEGDQSAHRRHSITVTGVCRLPAGWRLSANPAPGAADAARTSSATMPAAAGLVRWRQGPRSLFRFPEPREHHGPVRLQHEPCQQDGSPQAPHPQGHLALVLPRRQDRRAGPERFGQVHAAEDHGRRRQGDRGRGHPDARHQDRLPGAGAQARPRPDRARGRRGRHRRRAGGQEAPR
mmetsp:Transcript_3440/g.6372  ORF Transcript_3440/g.6372 Transcript_3440/m.6372 type:complete len:314 (+) Transcript_3440:1604-2545(+)